MAISSQALLCKRVLFYTVIITFCLSPAKFEILTPIYFALSPKISSVKLIYLTEAVHSAEMLGLPQRENSVHRRKTN